MREKKGKSSVLSQITKSSFWGILSVFGVIGVLCLSTACPTTIPVTYNEPAKLNLSGVSRIAIKSDDAQVRSNISDQLTKTGVYTIASPAELAEWEQWRTERQSMAQLKNTQATATEVSSTDLVAAYKANAVRADGSYGQKLVRISGIVAEIGRSGRGAYFARLEVGNDSVAIYFAQSELNQLASVNKGQTITVIGTNYGFTPPNMEDTAEILRLLGAGQRVNIADATFPVSDLIDYPGKVDAVITLDKETSVQDGSRIQKKQEAVKDSSGAVLKDANGKTVYQDVNVTIYERSITVAINYQIVRTRNGSLIGRGVKTGSANTSSEDRSKLTSASELEKKAISKPLQELASEVVPTERTMKLTLAKPDDNNAKKDMGTAEKLVKNKDYAAAAAAYGDIYAQYGNFAAGYNHAIVTEASQGTEKAMEMMTALVQKFSDNSTAQKTLGEMQQRDAANKQSAQQLSD